MSSETLTPRSRRRRAARRARSRRWPFVVITTCRCRARAEARDELDDALADRRLAAGQPHLADAEPREHRDDTRDLLERQQRRLGSNGDLLRDTPACSTCSGSCSGRSPRPADSGSVARTRPATGRRRPSRQAGPAIRSLAHDRQSDPRHRSYCHGVDPPTLDTSRRALGNDDLVDLASLRRVGVDRARALHAVDAKPL